MGDDILQEGAIEELLHNMEDDELQPRNEEAMTEGESLIEELDPDIVKADIFDPGPEDKSVFATDLHQHVETDHEILKGGPGVEKDSDKYRLKPAIFLVAGFIVLVLLFGSFFYFKTIKGHAPWIKEKLSEPSGGKLIKEIGIIESELKHFYIANNKSGYIFVINGAVKNNSLKSISFISVRGKLYNMKGLVVASEDAFAGNIINKTDLANHPFNKLKDILLNNRYGKARLNYKIEPGKEAPFMLVFGNLPSDLNDYSVEITGAAEAAP